MTDWLGIYYMNYRWWPCEDPEPFLMLTDHRWLMQSMNLLLRLLLLGFLIDWKCSTQTRVKQVYGNVNNCCSDFDLLKSQVLNHTSIGCYHLLRI